MDRELKMGPPNSQKPKKKSSYDFYLILATAVVLAIISAICVYGMFFFKLAQVHQLPPVAKQAYMKGMNQTISPFLVCLLLILGICVPKRLLPTTWLNRFAMGLSVLLTGIALWAGIKPALLTMLVISLLLQTTVLILALTGSGHLNFEKKGYWLRVGSSLIHLGLILFVLDLFLYRHPTLHLFLFWVTTAATVIGMLCCFYAESLVGLLRAAPPGPPSDHGR